MMKDSSLLGCDTVFQVFHRIFKSKQFKKDRHCTRREATDGCSGNGISSWSIASKPTGGGVEAACMLALEKLHF
jgi:hypothetical protein